MWHQTKRVCFIYAQPGVGFEQSVKKMESWMLSVVKMLFWVKLQGHQSNLNSHPVFPWPPHFQVIIVSLSFLHRKLKAHKNYYLCQKLSAFFNALWRYYKNAQALDTEITSRISTENWYQEFAAFFEKFQHNATNSFLLSIKIPLQKIRSPLPPQRWQNLNVQRCLDHYFKCHQIQTSA